MTRQRTRAGRGGPRLQGLRRDDMAVDQVLMTGSGRIRGGPSGSMVGATVRLVAAGIAPTDPALAEALGTAVTGEVKLAWQEGKPLNLSDVTLAGADYTLRTRGRVSGLGSGLALDGRVSAEAQNLARFSGLAGRPLAGRAEMEAAGSGSLLGGDLDLEGWIGGDGPARGAAAGGCAADRAGADRLFGGAGRGGDRDPGAGPCGGVAVGRADRLDPDGGQRPDGGTATSATCPGWAGRIAENSAVRRV